MSSPAVLAAVIGGLFTLVAAVIGARRGVSRNRRAARARGRLRLACPHVEISRTPDGGLAIRALPISPPGSLHYLCRFCGGVFHQADVPRIQNDWLEALNADFQKASRDYQKAWKAARKARNKYELLGGE